MMRDLLYGKMPMHKYTHFGKARSLVLAFRRRMLISPLSEKEQKTFYDLWFLAFQTLYSRGLDLLVVQLQ